MCGKITVFSSTRAKLASCRNGPTRLDAKRSTIRIEAWSYSHLKECRGDDQLQTFAKRCNRIAALNARDHFDLEISGFRVRQDET